MQRGRGGDARFPEGLSQPSITASKALCCCASGDSLLPLRSGDAATQAVTVRDRYRFEVTVTDCDRYQR